MRHPLETEGFFCPEVFVLTVMNFAVVRVMGTVVIILAVFIAALGSPTRFPCLTRLRANPVMSWRCRSPIPELCRDLVTWEEELPLLL